MRDAKSKMADRDKAIKFLSVVCKQTSFKGIHRTLDVELKQFFKVEDCGILFYNSTRDQLYTFHNQEDEEEEVDPEFLQ